MNLKFQQTQRSKTICIHPTLFFLINIERERQWPRRHQHACPPFCVQTLFARTNILEQMVKCMGGPSYFLSGTLTNICWLWSQHITAQMSCAYAAYPCLKYIVNLYNLINLLTQQYSYRQTVWPYIVYAQVSLWTWLLRLIKLCRYCAERIVPQPDALLQGNYTPIQAFESKSRGWGKKWMNQA